MVTIPGRAKMTFRNKCLEVGDLVETIWTEKKGEPVLTGLIIDIPEYWKERKVTVLWNHLGVRIEWINDIRRLNSE